MSPLRPGVQTQVLTSPPPRSSPTDSGTWFVVGTADQGRVDQPILIQSMSDFVRLLGARASYSVLYDALDVFFREGGGVAYVSRVVGPAAVNASRNLVDNVAATSLVVKALGPGSYGNNLKVAVIAPVAGGVFQIQVYDSTNAVLETSGDLSTQADAVAWSQNSQYVSITLGASALNPVVGGTNVIGALTSGADDRLNITDTQWQAALDRIPAALGPGQVSAPGRTTTTGYTQVSAHAAANGRTAILDAPDTPTVSTLTTSATSAKSGGNGRYAGLFAPWVIAAGVTPYTTRTVPPCALVAGAAARNDPLNGVGSPAAGDNGLGRYCTGLSQPAWDAATRDSLNTAGVDVLRIMLGAVTIYGWRSLADPINDPYWVPLGTVRYMQNLAARAWAAGQRFVFDQIDGQGRTISDYGAALTALVQEDWQTGQIYGATPDQAFNVDVGPQINTPTTLAGNELRAAIAVRPSPMAELVTIQIVNTPITQAVA